MRALAFRHVSFEHLGLIADALDACGIECQYVDLFENDQNLFSITDADALIFMGGPMSANDDLPYIRRELEIIAQAIARNKPVLGICLGSQLIAKALGAAVYRNPVKEIGWAPVYWTGAASKDPLFGALRAPETVFHWHGETFELPPGAELLAYSHACRHQAFRFKDKVYGLQFHLEVTPEMIADWCEQDANCADMREITTPIDPYANRERLAEMAAAVFGRWCALVAE